MQRQKRYRIHPKATRIIYARIPSDVGDALEQYGQSRALTLTAAIVALLKAGLAATEKEGTAA